MNKTKYCTAYTLYEGDLSLFLEGLDIKKMMLFIRSTEEGRKSIDVKLKIPTRTNQEKVLLVY